VQRELDEKVAPVPSLRDPLAVLSSFDHQLDSDQVDGDTEAKFREFLLQHLEPREKPPTKSPLVYIRFEPVDLDFAREVRRAVKALGLVPQLAPHEGSAEERAAVERRSLARADQVLTCWANATEAAVLNSLTSDLLLEWKGARSQTAKLTVLVGGPATETKAARLEDGFEPDADGIVDATTSALGDVLRPVLR
jgi:hypothetical protein